jgi:hydroxycarboxylate dehydrogenase B
MAETRITPGALTRFAIATLQALGSDTREARIVADDLVAANLAGHDSHGVGMLPAYAANVRKGVLKTNRRGTIVMEAGALATVEGDGGYGQVIARDAMEVAIRLARVHGVAVLSLRRTHHIGRVGAYGEMLAEAGLTSMHYVNGNSGAPPVAPWRGREGRFATNPVCIAVPGTAHHPRFVLDFATSRIAMGKVRVAHNAGKAVAEGALLGPNGAPTTDPGVMYRQPRGVLLPFGEHKGYGLALACDLLAGVVGAAGSIQPGNPRDRGIVNGTLTVAIDAKRFGDEAAAEAEYDALMDYVKSCAPADPALPVLVAGDPERLTRAARTHDGVPVDEGTLQQLDEVAVALGIAKAGSEQDRPDPA